MGKIKASLLKATDPELGIHYSYLVEIEYEGRKVYLQFIQADPKVDLYKLSKLIVKTINRKGKE